MEEPLNMKIYIFNRKTTASADKVKYVEQLIKKPQHFPCVRKFFLEIYQITNHRYLGIPTISNIKIDRIY